MPRPWIATRRLSRLSLPRRAMAVARMPAKTPIAAWGAGSPAAVVLVTWRVCWAMQSMSATDVPLSMAVI